MKKSIMINLKFMYIERRMNKTISSHRESPKIMYKFKGFLEKCTCSTRFDICFLLMSASGYRGGAQYLLYCAQLQRTQRSRGGRKHRNDFWRCCTLLLLPHRDTTDGRRCGCVQSRRRSVADGIVDEAVNGRDR